MSRKSNGDINPDGRYLRRRSVADIHSNLESQSNSHERFEQLHNDQNKSPELVGSTSSLPFEMEEPRVVQNRPIISFPDLYPNFVQTGRGSKRSNVNVNGGNPIQNNSRSLRKRFANGCQNYCQSKSLKSVLLGIFPFVTWFQEYNIKEWLVADIISGFTSAIYQIPQGLGNALLAQVEPVIGLYTSFFPGLFYCFLGTSRQTSVGTFTVLALMMGNVITKHGEDLYNTVSETVIVNGTTEIYYTRVPVSNVEIATAVSFLSGLVQIALCLLRLGKLGVLISPALANGFTAGCAIQIAISQLKGMFQADMETQDDMFGVYLTLKEFFTKVVLISSPVPPILSLVVVITLIIGKDLIGPRFQKLTNIPLPVDLIVVICATLASSFLELGPKYHVKVTGHIPMGLPGPIFPNLSIFRTIFIDSMAIGLVGFASTYSMAALFAKKYNHKIDANQELLALGISNVAGGIFSSIPASGSLARSSVLESVNCKTQLTTMISSVLLIIVIFSIAPFMEALPKCVLAASIFTAVKVYIKTFKEIYTLWPISRADSIVWAVTSVSVIAFNVSYGLLAGVITALFSVTWRMHNHRGTVLKEYKSSGIYLTHSKSKKVGLVSDLGSVVIFRFASPLFFATSGHFERDISRVIKEINRHNQTKESQGESPQLVVDCSSICFIDANGVQILEEVINACKDLNIDIVLAASPDNMIKTLEESGILRTIGYSKIFPSVQDAVRFAGSNQNLNHKISDLSQSIPYV